MRAKVGQWYVGVRYTAAVVQEVAGEACRSWRRRTKEEVEQQKAHGREALHSRNRADCSNLRSHGRLRGACVLGGNVRDREVTPLAFRRFNRGPERIM